MFKFERFVLTDTVTNNLTSSTKPKGPEEHKLPYIADTSNFLESFTIQPNFDCFQTHGFHKLMLKKKAENSFSILHTNKCSLYANSEDLKC